MTDVSKRFKVLLGAALVVLLVCGVWAYQIFFGSNTFSGAAEKIFYVSRGQSFGSIVDSLESQGIIRDRALFVFVAKMYGGTSRLQVGKYMFKSGVSNADIFLAIRTGRGNSLIAVTIPEGILARAQAKLFARSIGIDSARYVNLVYDEAFTRSLGIDSPSLEGYLIPETYGFYWEQDEKDVLRGVVDQFKHFYNDSLHAKAQEMGWTTNQVLTLASIVEGEAVLSEERPIISGVYHNRLRKGMRLEADPTIQFIFENGPRRVLYSDLLVDHPYNTYRNKGLPPGPVNNPGKASIVASLYPTQHAYLFFVANGSGGHWFTRTYAEHQHYVRMFRKQRARNHSALLLRAENSKALKAN